MSGEKWKAETRPLIRRPSDGPRMAVDQPQIVGHDVGHGEVRGQGKHPSQASIAFIHLLQTDIGEGADADFNGGECGRALDDAFHKGVPFLEAGPLEGFERGKIIGRVQGDRRYE